MQTVRANHFTSQVPRRIVVRLGGTGAFSRGFQLFDLNFLCAHVDGERFPSRLIISDFVNGHFLEAYETIYRDRRT